MLTAEEIKKEFEHCDPARERDLLDTMRELAELPGNYRNKARQLFRAADAGQQLYMAKIKAGFADEE